MIIMISLTSIPVQLGYSRDGRPFVEHLRKMRQLHLQHWYFIEIQKMLGYFIPMWASNALPPSAILSLSEQDVTSIVLCKCHRNLTSWKQSKKYRYSKDTSEITLCNLISPSDLVLLLLHHSFDYMRDNVFVTSLGEAPSSSHSRRKHS